MSAGAATLMCISLKGGVAVTDDCLSIALLSQMLSADPQKFEAPQAVTVAAVPISCDWPG